MLLGRQIDMHKSAEVYAYPNQQFMRRMNVGFCNHGFRCMKSVSTTQKKSSVDAFMVGSVICR